MRKLMTFLLVDAARWRRASRGRRREGEKHKCVNKESTGTKSKLNKNAWLPPDRCRLDRGMKKKRVDFTLKFNAFFN